jgi:hypothetical protein
MKKLALLIALVAAIGFTCEPASAFFFGGGGSCGGGTSIFGGGGPFGKLFGGKTSYCGANQYGCAPAYGCYPAPCKVYKKKGSKAGAAAAPKAKKEKTKK